MYAEVIVDRLSDVIGRAENEALVCAMPRASFTDSTGLSDGRSLDCANVSSVPADHTSPGPGQSTVTPPRHRLTHLTTAQPTTRNRR